jgi:hypothetical protein
VIFVERAPIRITIDPTCATGESGKSPITPGTTGYLLFALTERLKTPARRSYRWQGFFPMLFAP